jgi:uncharacterized membrane protein
MRGFGLERGFGHPVAGMIIGGILFLAFVAAIVWLIVWAVRSNKRNASLLQAQSQSGPAPKEIVQVRYAKGEITQAEYKKLLADLDK